MSYVRRISEGRLSGLSSTFSAMLTKGDRGVKRVRSDGLATSGVGSIVAAATLKPLCLP